MLREDKSEKLDWTLVTDGPMFRRWAEHLTKGGVKHGKRNWTLAKPNGQETEDFRAGAFRHFMSWFNGETDEDHAAALFFNVNGVEYLKEKK
jgi:hypothetical protein